MTAEAMFIGFLGHPSAAAQEAWSSAFPGARIVSLKSVASDGRRLGRRSLGLGLDALRLAMLLRMLGARRVLTMNPWTAVALRLLGLRDVATVGLYAVPGSRPWRLLRLFLGSQPVITTARKEATRWVADGGRAVPVLWGGDLPVGRARSPAGQVHVFAGGSSDRDTGRVADLAAEVERDDGVVLHVADGSGPRSSKGVHWYPRLSSADFHRLMTACHVVVLPLAERSRAAGHMLFCAALQAGLPVAVSSTEGISEYLSLMQAHTPYGMVRDPVSVSELVSLGRLPDAERDNLVALWRRDFSTRAFASRVRDALSSLIWPP